MLHNAINAFQTLLTSSESLPHVISVSSHVFIGWAYSDLGEFDKAEQAFKVALRGSNDSALLLTNEYARYSLMYIYLVQNQPKKVIALEKRPWRTRLQAVYLARAYAALAQFEKAQQTLSDLKNLLPNYFTDEDSVMLSDYRAIGLREKVTIEHLLPKAHSVYCETDWGVGTQVR